MCKYWREGYQSMGRWEAVIKTILRWESACVALGIIKRLVEGMVCKREKIVEGEVWGKWNPDHAVWPFGLIRNLTLILSEMRIHDMILRKKIKHKTWSSWHFKRIALVIVLRIAYKEEIVEVNDQLGNVVGWIMTPQKISTSWSVRPVNVALYASYPRDSAEVI